MIDSKIAEYLLKHGYKYLILVTYGILVTGVPLEARVVIVFNW